MAKAPAAACFAFAKGMESLVVLDRIVLRRTMTGNVPDGRHCPGHGSGKTFEDLRDKYGMILKGNDEIMLVIPFQGFYIPRLVIIIRFAEICWSWFQGEALMRKARGQDAWRSVVESVGVLGKCVAQHCSMVYYTKYT